MQAEPTQLTGAEQVAWDLSDLYAGVDDPVLAADMQSADDAAAALEQDYRGHRGAAPDGAGRGFRRYENCRTGTRLVLRDLIWSTDTANPSWRFCSRRQPSGPRSSAGSWCSLH